MGKIFDMMSSGYRFKADNPLYIGLADEFHGDIIDFFQSGLLTIHHHGRHKSTIQYTEYGKFFLTELFRINNGEPTYLDAVLLIMEMSGELKRNKNGTYQLAKEIPSTQPVKTAVPEHQLKQVQAQEYSPQAVHTALCVYNATFALDPIRWFLLYTEHPNKSRTVPRIWTLKSPDGQLVIVKNMVTWIRAHPEYFGSDDRSVRRTYIAFKRIAHCMRLGSSRRISCKGWTIARLPE